jgi:hypothetical protein
MEFVWKLLASRWILVISSCCRQEIAVFAWPAHGTLLALRIRTMALCRRMAVAGRRMAVETLEDRRMLATFTVTNLLDGAVTAAGQLPGSLRQAIFDANAAAGADDIVFNGGHDNAVRR